MGKRRATAERADGVARAARAQKPPTDHWQARCTPRSGQDWPSAAGATLVWRQQDLYVTAPVRVKPYWWTATWRQPSYTADSWEPVLTLECGSQPAALVPALDRYTVPYGCLMIACGRPGESGASATEDAAAQPEALPGQSSSRGIRAGFTEEGHPFLGEAGAPVTLKESKDPSP